MASILGHWLFRQLQYFTAGNMKMFFSSFFLPPMLALPFVNKKSNSVCLVIISSSLKDPELLGLF